MLLIQLTGLSGAGKSTLAAAAREKLLALGHKVEVIDGDVYRSHICRDLGFSKADRMENIRRLGFIGLTLAKQGVITFLAAISPYEEVRHAIQTESDLVKTVFLSCPIDALIEHDVKGLYKRALLPENHPEHLQNFTGISAPYEIPATPDLVLHTHQESAQSSLQKLLDFVLGQLHSLEKQGPVVVPKAMFIGRWQPFHNGHKWLIDNKLKQGIPVLIAVRNLPRDEQNPFTTEQTITMLRSIYQEQDVEVMAIPDIESVNYGRLVGYEVNCFDPPSDVGAISATDIRDQIRQHKTGWKQYVDCRIHALVEQFLSNG